MLILAEDPGAAPAWTTPPGITVRTALARSVLHSTQPMAVTT